MADPLTELFDDLHDEHEALDAVVAPLSDERWDARTPAAGWRVRDQIGHLAYFDEAGRQAAVDPDGFVAGRDRGLADLDAFTAQTERLGRELTGFMLLAAWRAARAAMLDALADLAASDASARLPWYGPPMSLRSFATARLMETWAHGQDVVDGLGLPLDARPVTDRLRHIAFLGCATRGWSYVVRDRVAPDTPVRVELSLPSGATFINGGDDAEDVVRGSALDFCLVVTQRRNVADTGLSVVGPAAREWLSIAQCFAGGATLPPAPRSG
ncbi:MAG TPA: TIGR03084 family metal-binding protein [Acidimicrobiales bacterium]|nr:TIGR03084 family metal-binding protein [Acidimicrobiales bacterium]